jgi:CheY-like chemotaxis protein
LLQAQKMDAIGKLTGGIAHDFNNLLASVLSGLSLLKRRAPLDDRSLEVLDMTRHAAEQGKYLVGRLLAFSRRQNLAPRVVDLTSITRSLDAMLAPILGGLVTLTWELEPGLWNTFVDSAQLELAIMNLVINARDALPQGGAISIKLRNREHSGSDDLPPGEFVVVTVSDTGSGIPAELLSKVIEPFFTTKDVGKGTGLGLSTAYGFARQSGGTLRISSVANQGTDVEIWLPRSGENVAAPAFVLHAEPESATPASRLTHVLLVDDSQTLRSLTEMQLVAEGFAVTTASSGSEAMAMIDRDPDMFDLILTDFAMPLMSGVELVKAVRDRRADWPAVIVTGYAQTEALSGRPVDVPVLAKPFSTVALIDAIEQSLRRGQLSQQSG